MCSRILLIAAHGPSGNLMGLELGWLHLQRGELPMALSTLSDEVTRNPLSFEAHCLLLECYWTVRRFDEMKRLADILRKEKCGNTAIDHAALLARLGLQELEPEWLQKQLALAKGSPLSIYNAQVALAGQQALGGWDCLLDKLVVVTRQFDCLSRSPCPVKMVRRRNTLPLMHASYPMSPEKIGQPDMLARGYVGTYSPPADYKIAGRLACRGTINQDVSKAPQRETL